MTVSVRLGDRMGRRRPIKVELQTDK